MASACVRPTSRLLTTSMDVCHLLQNSLKSSAVICRLPFQNQRVELPQLPDNSKAVEELAWISRIWIDQKANDSGQRLRLGRETFLQPARRSKRMNGCAAACALKRPRPRPSALTCQKVI